MSTVLYHYTTYDVGVELILADRKLRASPLAKTNDPYEYKQRTMGVGFSRVETPRVRPSEVAMTWKALIEQQTKLLCFTVDSLPDESAEFGAFAEGFAKARMWAQYGANHSGVCLGFDLAALLSHMSSGGRVPIVSVEDIDSLSGSTLPLIIHGPVKYGSLPDQQPVITNSDLKKMELSQSLVRILLDKAQSILFSKSLEWSSENEYRVVVIWPTEGYQRFNVGQSIVSVSLGAKAPQDDEVVFQRLRDTPCTLYRMVWEGGVPSRYKQDELYFLRKRVLRRISQLYKNFSQTPSCDDFVQNTYGKARWSLYWHCVNHTTLDNSDDEIAKLSEWIVELDSERCKSL
jgi:hypothetical protein